MAVTSRAYMYPPSEITRRQVAANGYRTGDTTECIIAHVHCSKLYSTIIPFVSSLTLPTFNFKYIIHTYQPLFCSSTAVSFIHSSQLMDLIPSTSFAAVLSYTTGCFTPFPAPGFPLGMLGMSAALRTSTKTSQVMVLKENVERTYEHLAS